MAVGGHEGGLGFFNGAVVGDVFAGGVEGIAEVAEHIAHTAIGGGFMGKIALVAHVLRLDPGDARKRRVQGQGG